MNLAAIAAELDDVACVVSGFVIDPGDAQRRARMSAVIGQLDQLKCALRQVNLAELAAAGVECYCTCSRCGCTDVQITAWINANDDFDPGGDAPRDEVWCPQCNRDTSVKWSAILQPYDPDAPSVEDD